jgi:mediator of RNA polymerase II transcription subunit 31
MSNLPPAYPGYPMSGPVNPQPPPHPAFQQPKASPSHQSQMSVRGSPSHTPSQMPSMRGSPSHTSQLPSVRSSPSHPSPSQLPSIRSSPSHPSQLQQVPTGAQALAETDEQQKLRFQVEMEFVQCLANPNYLHFLAQRGFLKDPSFVNYLKYLQYWQEPQYVKYLKYPICLHFLQLLQHETFRKECVSGQCARFLDDQVILHWQHYTRRRAKLIDTAAGSAQQTASNTPGSISSRQK